MVKAVGETISAVDVCMLVVEPENQIHPAEEELLSKIKKQGDSRILLLTN